ncbi:unnamed protein product [Ranitomeya imitator]|uniref:Uncharacterized protein n=1 Tax=Ranitomeya imitator TaxID=111125 RepID=A0ABN9MM83_9NEOB|nr:unnamed protein product [Ranitomeya imitator]
MERTAHVSHRVRPRYGDGKDEHGYHLFPERDPRNPKQEPLLSRLYGLKIRCKARLKMAMDTSPHVKLL